MKILMLSGGLDSTYLLWHLLRSGERPHIHHIHLINDVEKMHIPQKDACDNILRYFKKYRLRYSESSFEFRRQRRIGVDNDIILMVAQKICQNTIGKNIEVLQGWIQYDLDREFVVERAKRETSKRLWEALVNSAWNHADISPQIKMPLIDLQVTKKSILAEMPAELAAMTWSCRKPLFNNKTYAPCGNCHACKERF